MKTERVQYMRGILIVLLVLALVVPVQADKLDMIITNLTTVDDYVDTEVGAIRDSLEDANDILQVLATPAFGYSSPKFVSVTVDHSNAAWDDAATNEVFDVTGHVEFWMCVYDSVLIGATNATDSLRILVGTSLVASFLGDGWDAGEFVSFGGAAVAGPTLTGANACAIDGIGGTIRLHGFSLGTDIGYEHVTAVCLTGSTRWLIWWRPLNSTGGVVAGAGGTL